jgi:pimeloyl-ACP methyl ester carboxylesterase
MAESAGQPESIDRTLDLPGRGRLWVRDIPGPTPDAPTVLLLHGLGATARLNWGPSFRPLSERYRVVAFDHRGHGRGLRTRRFRLSECADDAAAVADALGVERVLPVGYSMGGPVAMLLWKRHPQRVAGLVLCATARHFVERRSARVGGALMPVAAGVVRLAPGRMRQRMIEGSLSRAYHPRLRERVLEEMRGHDPASVMQAAGRAAVFSSHGWIGDVDVPTAVVVTTRDTVVSPRRQRKLAEAIAQAEVFEVEGDHVACVAAAERFVPALLDACGHVVARGGS